MVDGHGREMGQMLLHDCSIISANQQTSDVLAHELKGYSITPTCINITPTCETPADISTHCCQLTKTCIYCKMMWETCLGHYIMGGYLI